LNAASGEVNPMYPMIKELIAEGHNVTLLPRGFSGAENFWIKDKEKLEASGAELINGTNIAALEGTCDDIMIQVVCESLVSVQVFQRIEQCQELCKSDIPSFAQAMGYSPDLFGGQGLMFQLYISPNSGLMLKRFLDLIKDRDYDLVIGDFLCAPKIYADFLSKQLNRKVPYLLEWPQLTWSNAGDLEEPYSNLVDIFVEAISEIKSAFPKRWEWITGVKKEFDNSVYGGWKNFYQENNFFGNSQPHFLTPTFSDFFYMTVPKER